MEVTSGLSRRGTDQSQSWKIRENMNLGKNLTLDLLSLRLCQDFKKGMFVRLAQVRRKEKKY